MSSSVIAWLSKSAPWGPILATACASMLAVALAVLPVTWGGLLVLGGTVLVLALIQPLLGLALVIAAVPFGSIFEARLAGMSVGATELLVGLALAAWLARRVARRDLHIRLPRLTLPLALFLGAALLSLLGATSLEYGAKELVKWIEVLALYLFVANELDERWTRILVVVILSTGAAAALQGIYQFLFRAGPEGFALFGRFMRAYGSFEQPNPYAGYLGLTLPLALGLLAAGILQARNRPTRREGPTVDRRVSWRWLVWAAGCGALMLAAMVMSWSRGAWLGLGAAVLVMLVAVVARSGKAVVLVTAFALLAAYLTAAGGIAYIPPSLVQRFSDFAPYLGIVDVRSLEITDANYAVIERMAHWQAAWAMWTDHPWLGVGIGNYEPVYARYAVPQWPLPLGHAHNYYLNIAAEAGVFGLLAFLLLWGGALAEAWRASRRAVAWNWGVALGVLGVLVHVSVHNLVDDLFVHGMYLQLAILLGMLPILSRRPA